MDKAGVYKMDKVICDHVNRCKESECYGGWNVRIFLYKM